MYTWTNKEENELWESQEVTYYHDIAMAAQKAMKADVLKAMQVFYAGK